jgi:AAA domain/Bifunctional DNA primase/polymerase, N-terminal
VITTDLRLAVQANGYAPIPCNGKVPAIPAWQNTADASCAEIARWTGTNTGVLTAFTPAIDIDITDPTAATVAEDTAKELFSDRGKVPVRFGRLPKRTLPFRTMVPFPKMAASFKAPGRDEIHKVEILGDGQQFVIDGIHPDTNEPYTWHGGTPWNTPRDELAEVTEADMQAYLELVAERLAEEFGWERVYTNGHGGARAARQVGATQLDVARPVDVDTRLEAMQFGGAGDNAIHPTQVSVTASLLRTGLTFDETVRTVLEATKAAMARDARAQNWDWDEEELGLERMVASFISKNTELAHLLPDGLREAFQQKIGRGAYLVYRRDRGWQAHAQRGMGDRRLGKLPAWSAEARDGADDIDEAGKTERPKAWRFRLVPFGELRPGPEPLYLVDELIPVAGLVDVWGKAKCFKSFWTLDLMLHVAMGWGYRDRYGAVVYCAFEGAHGYKKRIEALRRHYGIAEGAEVPLYVMPGQANLIAEHRLLISDIAEQLDGVTPSAVVLDTLNKSLVGSENKDVDMGAYVRAAEAIRDRFGCVKPWCASVSIRPTLTPRTMRRSAAKNSRRPSSEL